MYAAAHHASPAVRRAFGALAAGLIIVSVVAACGAEAGPSASPAGLGASAAASGDPGVPSASGAPLPVPSVAPADAAAVADLRSLIEAADLTDPASLNALASRRFDDGAAEAAAAILAAGAAGDTRWAATWVYGTSGWDPAILRPLLADPDPSIRALAAAALLAWGDAAAVPVLLALSGFTENLAGSYPPASIEDFAAGTLARFIDGDPNGTLTYNPETGLWTAR